MEEIVFKKILKKLVLYKKVFTHTFVPPEWISDEQLAHWSAYFRANWKKLPSKYKNALKEIGFIYLPNDVSWFTFYYKLSDFLQENSLDDLKLSKPHLKKLYGWFYRQKFCFKHKMLSELQKEMFSKLGITFQRTAPDPEKLWMTRYRELVAYKEKHGNCNVPSHIKEYKVLHRWVIRQRRSEKFKQHRLTPERKKLLSNIGFPWSIHIKKKQKEHWDNRIKELIAYEKKFGTLTISSVDPAYHSLNIWTSKLRQQERELHPARRKQLLAIGFPFTDTIQKRRHEKWEKMYQKLRVYYRKHKHSRVSAHDKNYPGLGAWVIAQRRKGKEGVTKEQRRKLMQLRFVWDIQAEVKKDFNRSWEGKFKEVQKFYNTYGHCKVPKLYLGQGGLYSWLNLQRENRFKLTPEKIKKLNSVQFEWVNTREMYHQRQWENRYNALLAYYKKQGHINVSGKENRPLSLWINQVKRRIIKMTPKRLEQLKKVKFEWPEKVLSLEEKWYEKFKQLKEFYKDHRHFKIPQLYKGNSSLADWLKHQRKLYRLGKLKKEHKELLEKVNKKILSK